MSHFWFQMDNNFWQHPKFIALSADAGWLYMRLLGWANNNTNDGRVPAVVVQRLFHGSDDAISELLDVVLLEEVEDGWKIHDFEEYQNGKTENLHRSAEKSEKARQAAYARWRNTSSDANPMQTQCETDANAMQAHMQTQCETDANAYANAMQDIDIDKDKDINTCKSINTCNSQSFEQNSETPPKPLAALAEPPSEPDPDQAFEEFWAAYPRHSAKKTARQKFTRAVKAGTPPEVIIAGARRYRDDPNRDPAYTAMPTTWLNQERWHDDPLPARASPAAHPDSVLTRSQQAAVHAMRQALEEQHQQTQQQDSPRLELAASTGAPF